ncbi:MAG TPA: hypothetical protein VMM78_12610 [Thermomicrobiales bacterium]|nr:hypothetical protein [Thermomicrobiales bacterium]
MDVIVDLGKAALAVGGLVLVLLLIPIFFMSIFVIATAIDHRMDK